MDAIVECEFSHHHSPPSHYVLFVDWLRSAECGIRYGDEGRAIVQQGEVVSKWRQMGTRAGCSGEGRRSVSMRFLNNFDVEAISHIECPFNVHI